MPERADGETRGGWPWKDEIAPRLSGLKLAPAREAEIVEELSHLEDRYRELLGAGVLEAEAMRMTLAAG